MDECTKLMELRPNRSLLDSNFNGYKLSLEEVPLINHQLGVPVDRIKPDTNQYSLLHVKLFMLQNHLIGENCEGSESVYFIDKTWNIKKMTIDSITNTFVSETVWQIPLLSERSSGDYNVTMKLISDKFAVIADGLGTLYVLDRRNENNKWATVFSEEIIGPGENFVISDAIHKQCSKEEIHLLLLTIKKIDLNEKTSTVLHWVTLTKTDTWNQVALRQLTVQGFVQYSYLERSCEAVYVVSETGCQFTVDSENEIKKHEEPVYEKKYTWTQTEEDLTLKFPIRENVTKSSINVKTETVLIEIKCEEDILLSGNLYQQIDSDITCWTVTDNIVEIVLQKTEKGLMWPEVVKGDKHGEYVPDPAVLSEISQRLLSLTSDNEVSPPTGTTFNSQQVEECDFECDNLTIFERLHCNSHNVTHKVYLGSHQVLLTVCLDKDLPPALGIRHDVDTCIWQPIIESSNDFKLEHTGTLLALGYIQASKQQMKFFTCSPDFSYSVICESSKHLFFYCQKKKIASHNELRNRITGQRVNTLAQQQVLNLPFNEEILGVYASNSYLYVLGENFITAFSI